MPAVVTCEVRRRGEGEGEGVLEVGELPRREEAIIFLTDTSAS